MNKDQFFEIYEDPYIQKVENVKNVTLNHQGQICEIKIQLVRNSKAKENPRQNIEVKRSNRTLYIRIPRVIFFKNLFANNNLLERVILSKNGRLLMCGKILI